MDAKRGPKHGRVAVASALITFVSYALVVVNPALATIDVWVDPGHGGSDPGNVGINGDGAPNEEHVTLPIGSYLLNRLGSFNYTCYQTRYDDRFVSLADRAKMASGGLANHMGEVDSAQLFLSVHLDAATKKDAQGRAVIDPATKKAAQDTTVFGTETVFQDAKHRTKFQELGLSGEYANEIHTHMISGIAAQFIGCHTDRHVKRQDIQVLRENHTPAVLIEVCFYSNRCQFDKINLATTQAAVAEAIATGVTYTPICPVIFCGGSRSPSPQVPTPLVKAVTRGDTDGSRQMPERSLTTLNEGFEGAIFPPSGWSLQTAGAPPPSTWGRSTDSVTVHAGVASAFIAGEYAGTSDEWLVSPHFKVEPTDTGLRFYWAGSAFWANALDATCQVRQVGIGSWTQVWSLASEPDVDPFIFRERVVSLAAWSGDSIQVAFRVQGSNGADFAVDDVSAGVYTPTGPPSNETCTTAMTLPAGDINVDGVTCYAANDLDPFATDGSGCVPTAMDGGDVTYKFTASALDWITATVTSQWNPSVYLLNDCGTPITSCRSAGFAQEGTQSAELAYQVPTTGTYYLVVDSPAGTCGPFHLSGTISLLLTDVPVGSPTSLAPRFEAWPNPSRGVFRLRGTLPVSDSRVPIEVYDVSGRLVASAMAEIRGGRFETDLVQIKGRELFAAGVYFANIHAGGVMLRRKLVVVR
jgi:N-acetylmuramoyl-L-alanine amidase